MKRFDLANIAGGWFVFFVAATVYIMTVEPTASFWDCGEFITSAYKLQIGHPPGAPVYMLLGRLFSLFAADPSAAARSINILSAAASAFTIMFLFWTITHLAKKIAIKEGNYTTENIIITIGAGLTGALAFTFSDTFWFSATEAEVYALSSLFTAFVFWAALKWENEAGQPYASRWIILIAYLMGLSIGVHLLSLLVIPAIVFIYYFRNYPVSPKGFLKTLLVALILLVTFMYGIIQGLVKASSYFELFFVNNIGLPYKSGMIVFLFLILMAVVGGLAWSIRIKNPLMNIIILSFAVIMTGYSSFSLIVIRSLADPPMDQNSPDNIFSLLYYLNREQYGSRPLLHGPYYNAPVTGEKETTPAYIQKNGRYEPARESFSYLYDSRFKTIFPRMYSADPDHTEAYKEWGRISGKPVNIMTAEGEAETLIKPTFNENMRFFFRYQLGHMYGRYFMWNFAGRQNDLQGHGRMLEGNWLSGIHFLDEIRLGPQYGLPRHLENNRARNKYYLLPLILGLTGLLFHMSRNRRDAWVVFLLFFFTGVAIVIYLNQTPYQPRERDYAYAGSFYAFAIWIGLGVLAVYDNLRKYARGAGGALLSVMIPLISVPGMMAIQNWDDHDRSGRYTARDFGWNYLQSCAPDAILFTYGDNDTFPLWYAQEVEGMRTDVRVVNLSYLGADWYIEQMKRKVYDSDPLPLSMEREQYVQGTRDIVYLFDRMEGYADLHSALSFALSDEENTRIRLPRRGYADYIPSKRFSLPVDKSRVIETGTVTPELSSMVDPAIEWEVNRNFITKSGLAILDILANNNWERPVYFAITVPSTEYLGLEEYFQLEGLAYRLVPVKAGETGNLTGRTHTDIMFRNVTEKFKWGNINDPGVYLDETNRRLASNLRSIFGRLAGDLLKEGKADSAVVILDLAMDKLPHESVPYNYFIVPIVENYYLAGEGDKASAIAGKKSDLLRRELNYYFSLDRRFRSYVDFEKRRALSIYQELLRAVTGNDADLQNIITADLNSYYQLMLDS